jgi:hypothetical protein
MLFGILTFPEKLDNNVQKRIKEVTLFEYDLEEKGLVFKQNPQYSIEDEEELIDEVQKLLFVTKKHLTLTGYFKLLRPSGKVKILFSIVKNDLDIWSWENEQTIVEDLHKCHIYRVNEDYKNLEKILGKEIANTAGELSCEKPLNEKIVQEVNRITHFLYDPISKVLRWSLKKHCKTNPENPECVLTDKGIEMLLESNRKYQCDIKQCFNNLINIIKNNCILNGRIYFYDKKDNPIVYILVINNRISYIDFSKTGELLDSIQNILYEHEKKRITKVIKNS